MYRNDKITSVEKIEIPKVVSDPEKVFYLFFAPKTENQMMVAIITGRLLMDKTDKKIPVVPNEWNPMVFKSADITSDILSKYDVFTGEEG